MPASLNVSYNCSLAGINVVAAFDSAHLTGTGTVYRITPGRKVPVRGMYQIPAATAPGASMAVVDTEVPLDINVSYQFIHTWGPGGADFSQANSTTVNLLAGCPSVGEFVLRNLFFTEASLITDMAAGTLQDVQTKIRSGKFAVIGRSDPVVVVDAVESDTGTYRFLARDEEERELLKSLLTSGDPLAIQSADTYGIGIEGVNYFMPDSVTEVRLSEDGRFAPRAFDVDYVRISPPPFAVTFSVPGRTFEYINTNYGTFSDVLAAFDSFYEMMYGESMLETGLPGTTPGTGTDGIIDGGSPTSIYAGSFDGGGV
jgi:hypothetical protein